ncbi:Ionotropic receptor 25a-like 3, partial [Homarus americanus]
HRVVESFISSNKVSGWSGVCVQGQSCAPPLHYTPRTLHLAHDCRVGHYALPRLPDFILKAVRQVKANYSGCTIAVHVSVEWRCQGGERLTCSGGESASVNITTLTKTRATPPPPSTPPEPVHAQQHHQQHQRDEGSPSCATFLSSPAGADSPRSDHHSILDESLQEGVSWLEEAVSQAQRKTGLSLSQEIVKVSLDNENDGKDKLCSALYNGVAVVMDMTAGGWTHARDTAAAHGVPYLRLQVSNYQWMAATDDLLRSRNATDAALIFGSEAQLDQALYYLVEGSVVRVIVLSGVDESTTETLKKMRPSPSYYVILGTTEELSKLFTKAVQNKLVTRDSRWTLVATDHKQDDFDRGLLMGSTGVTMMTPVEEVCCTVRNRQNFCDCDSLVIPKELTVNTMLTLTKALKANGATNVQGTCEEPVTDPPSTASFYSAFQTELGSWPNVVWNADKLQTVPELKFDIIAINSSATSVVGSWNTSKELVLNPQYEHSPIRRHFKIGTIMLSARLAEHMKFDFELKFPDDGQYGARQKNGSWNGLVGDLSNGVTDIIVAPLTMTSEREEVIDFVAPYFDQSGISIVIQKRQREENLFKFMTVLRAEVWVSIVAALVVTGIMIWLLDRYSPYSAQNNPDLYPPQCRKFTLKESFWFALTSFTPQGGGEAPKALSGRTLVAAYWLFVVLMLATFTANLAAFLTVERMQTPVSSLDELAGQSKINYTVLQSTATYQYFANMAAAEEELYRDFAGTLLCSVSEVVWVSVSVNVAVGPQRSPVQSLEALAHQAKINFTTTRNSAIYEYFHNMAKAEDELFRVWKELTLNSTSDQSKYRVWDYPIKEQYTHILQVIQESGPVERAKFGFEKVLKDKNGEFAFIHDASEIRYEVYHNCLLTEVGEPFAEQPYAIAVQQGSHLQDEISRAILELQKDRYFEALSAQFWNSSARGSCPNDNDSEGITLQSLGGVFIATLIGLALAMIALAAEVLYYKRGGTTLVSDLPPKMALKKASEKDHISRINVTPVY